MAWLLPWWALAIPVAAFIALIAWHQRVLESRRIAERAVDFYQRGIDRVEERWAGRGETGERFLDPHHPYAADLDLFGKGSLFELISTARTRAGEATLAGWFLNSAALPEIRSRQEAVAELRNRVDLREALSLLGENFRSGVHPEELASWAVQPGVRFSAVTRVLAFVLATIALVLLYAFFGIAQAQPFIRSAIVALGLIEAAWVFRFRRIVRQSLEAVEHPGHDLALLSQVLHRLEAEQFASPRLKELRAALDVAGQPASQRIARLNRIVELVDSRDNFFVRLFGPLLLWSTQLTFAVENWRRISGASVPRWLRAVGEIEALSSLAGYAYEHPRDVFAEFTGSGPEFRGEALAHPLLPESRSVRNDVALTPELRLLVVSGSNMSGKSTLLRTVGVNAVLAMAGAPVRASSLRISPLTLGASMRITDSLQEGSSRFYAEITRLRSIVDLAGGANALLFLLDELLAGTNSHDRRIGAEAVVRGLVNRGAIGLVTTHDLALAHIAESLAPRAENVHFEDTLEDGKMRFDYRMRPGVVQKSNALELMRAVGLDV